MSFSCTAIRRFLVTPAAAAALIVLCGCRPPLPPGKPVSELTPLEAQGHSVFQEECARCHNAYSTHSFHGPSLYGIFRQPYLPSGAPATDERVTAVVLHGRDMMPALGNEIDQEQLTALLAFLHTL